MTDRPSCVLAHRPRRFLFALPVIAVLAACYEGPGEPVVCTDEARPGVILRVFEAATMDPVTEGLQGTLVDDEYEENLAVLGNDNVLFGATERPGVYTATVQATGYEEGQLSNIVVTADECHVITRDLNVTLTPSP